MKNLVLKISNISKKFTLDSEHVNAPNFLDIIKSFFGKNDNNKRKSSDFWALKNISLELKRGENLGIVGLNGAGKSTLLKIMLNRLTPDGGSVKIDGSSGGLIELGAGFHPEQTGRKNIHLNARMLGISTGEIEARMDEILEFAELGEFIDMPVKTYSSGMSIRLGFSVAIHFVKDLIICDEILAVGDFEFKQKCYRKIHELKKDRSFVLVSHSTRDIELFCDKALFLHNGQVVEYGDVKKVMKSFSKVQRTDCYQDIVHKIKKEVNELKDEFTNYDVNRDVFKMRQFAESKEYRISKFDIIYHNSNIVDELLVMCSHPFLDGEIYIANDESFFLEISFNLHVTVSTMRIGIPIFDESGRMVIGSDSREFTSKDENYLSPGRKKITMSYKEIPLVEGRFYFVLAINNDPGHLLREHLMWVNVKNVSNLFGIVKGNAIWSK